MSPLTVYLDAVCINGMPILSTVDSRIKYNGALVPLKNRTTDSIYESLNNILRRSNCATIYVTSIESDIEFAPLFEDVEDNIDAKPNFAPSGKHIPAVERKKNTIADCIRVVVHCLPYNNVPRILLKHIAISETKTLNWFPAKNNISDTFSPLKMLTGSRMTSSILKHEDCSHVVNMNCNRSLNRNAK